VLSLSGRCLGVIALLLALNSHARAEMSKSTCWSAGSLFALARSCERKHFSSPGQIEAILADLDQHLSSPDKRRLKQGFEQGARRGRVFIPQQGWVTNPVDKAECARAQTAIDAYKTMLDLTLPMAGETSPAS
jgi:hypothetical protein